MTLMLQSNATGGHKPEINLPENLDIQNEISLLIKIYNFFNKSLLKKIHGISMKL